MGLSGGKGTSPVEFIEAPQRPEGRFIDD